jgi:hypothetical protein
MKYFTISELIKSDTAIKKKIWNGASREVEDNLIALVSAILDPLRDKYGKPITITSGYRCKELNRAVGGVSNSQHMTGEAADITVKSKTGNRQLAKMIVEMGLPFDQMIDECNYDWVHVSYKRVGNNRRQILRYKNKAYTNIDAKEL